MHSEREQKHAKLLGTSPQKASFPEASPQKASFPYAIYANKWGTGNYYRWKYYKYNWLAQAI